MTAPGFVEPAATGWWVNKSVVVFPQPAVLTVTGGTPDVRLPRVMAPTAGPLTLTGGTPTITVAPAIAFVSSATSTGATITMPTHQAGDTLLIFAFRTGTNVAASLPAGWANVINGGGSAASARVGTKVAASGSETSGTWTNAQYLVAAVYRNVSGVGASDRNDGSGVSNLIVPSLSLTVTNRTSWVVMFSGSNVATGSFPATTRNGFPRRDRLDGATEDLGLYDTGIWRTSFASDTIAYGSNANYQTVAVELLD